MKDWQRIEELFRQVVERPPSQRESFLFRSCPEDEDLRNEVLNLVQEDENAGDFLSRTALEVQAESLAISNRLEEGQEFGRFQILQVLGEGGSATVYLAKEKKSGSQFAIKVLDQELSEETNALRRFLREAKAASNLNYDRIVRVYGSEQVEGRHLLTMEFVEGVPLNEMLSASPLPVSAAIDFALQVADGLQFAHSKGLIHRDIKPSNILVSGENQIKILDFGISKLQPDTEAEVWSEMSTDSLTFPGTVLGSSGYTSPEQLMGRKTDHRSDIFNLGIVLFEMVSGEKPFTGRTLAEMIDQLSSSGPCRLTRIAPHAAILQPIVDKCLEKEPEDRYPNAIDLIEDLRFAQRGQEPGWVSKSESTPPKTRWQFWAVTALVLLAMLVSLILLL